MITLGRGGEGGGKGTWEVMQGNAANDGCSR